jgi:PKD repeat protein
MNKMIHTTFIMILVLWSLVALFNITPLKTSAYTPYDPIYIDGNEDFISVNGVKGGNGNPENPYIIEGWEIDTKAADGIKIKNTTAHFIIENCRLSGSKSHNGITFKNVTNGRIESVVFHNNSNGIYFIEASYNKIKSAFVQNNSNVGISLKGSSNNNIENSMIINNSYGIYIEEAWISGDPISYIVSSTNNRIENCELLNNSIGIKLFSGTSYTHINNSYVSQSNNTGISASSSTSTDTIICNSTISRNKRGIGFFGPHNKVINCSISSNEEYGIKFEYTSSDNIVTNSNISHNNEGILIGSVNDQNPSDIFIHHNNFINNTIQAGDWDIGTHNHWDDGAQGNYWSDYTGNDSNDDGIGDKPYNITLLIIYIGSNPPCNKDYYPLMNPAQIAIISNELPVPDFDFSPHAPTDLESVSFTDLSYDVDGPIVSWYWEFGDGSISYDQEPYHKYMDNGTYTITLTVTDNDHASNSISKDVIVTNVGPNATAGCDKTNISVGDVVSFTGTGYDNDGSIANWFWDFGDGNNSYLQNTTHIFSRPGTYNVSLMVTDDDDATATATLTIIVNEDTIGTKQGDKGDNIFDFVSFTFIVLIAAIIVISLIILISKNQAKSKDAKKPIKADEKKKTRRQKDNKKEWTKCPICKVRLKTRNLEGHMKKVHNKSDE